VLVTFPEPEVGGFPVEPTIALPLSSRIIDGAVVVSVGGEVDLLTAGQLADAISAALKDSPPAVVIDLTSVTFFSSAGLSVLVEADQKSETTAVRVVPGDVAERPITATGLQHLLAVFGSLEDALGSE
jgi:anti-anti-sigma factor